MWISLILHSFLFSLRYPGWSWAPECQEIRGLVTKQDTWSSYSDLCTWPQEYMTMHICNMYRYIDAQNAHINRKRKTLLKIDLWSSKITRSQVYEFLIIILCFTFFCFLFFEEELRLILNSCNPPASVFLVTFTFFRQIKAPNICFM